jgi:hypothetical protein
MPVIKESDPTAESVDRIVGPDISGIDRVPYHVLVEALASGGIDAFAFAIQNPHTVDCLILRVIVDITTAGGTATSVLDVDTVDTAILTGDDIIDGLDLNATGVSDNITNPGTNGDKKPVKWGKKGSATDFLTGKILVAAASSLVGQVVVTYVPLG